MFRRSVEEVLMAQLSLARPQRTESTRSTTQRIGDWLARYGVPWLFLLPTIVFFVGWAIYPIVRVAWISFLDYRPLAPQAVCLESNAAKCADHGSAYQDTEPPAAYPGRTSSTLRL